MVLLVLGILLFDIKGDIVEPLILGLHRSFVGLDEATIDRTIPVRDTIPVRLNIPLETDTVVTLTDPVPLQVNATIDLPGINAYGVSASVNLTLPEGLELPVALDLDVPVDEQLDVALDVRAIIPLQETQLHDVAQNLRLLFEPMAVALTSPQMPDGFDEVIPFASDVLDGSPPNLLDTTNNAYAQSPWPGFSTTAGLGYDLFDSPVPPDHQRVETGIVPIGGIPALDEQIRPEVYANGGPSAINQQATASMQASNVPPGTFTGDMQAYIASVLAAEAQSTGTATGTATGGGQSESQPGDDMGILPTPSDEP